MRYDYKYALDQSAIVSVTDRKGIIKHVNDNFCQFFQYSKEELIGQDIGIVHSDDHPSEFYRDIWDIISSGKIWKGEFKNKAKDGLSYWVDATIVPLLGTGGKPRQYVAIRRDITKRKKAEARKDLLASVINSSDEAIISVDLEHNITSWNRGAEKLLGYAAPEAIGKGIDLIIAPEQVAEEEMIISRIISGGYVDGYETERIRKDGTAVQVSLNVSPIVNREGHIIGAAKILRNISERKSLERRIEAKTVELAAVFDRITDGFIVLDRDFRYGYANRRIGEITGHPPGALLGKCIWDVFPEAVYSDTYYAFKEALEENRYVTNTDYYPPLDLWLENHIYPGPEGLSIFIRDVTQQKRTEKKLRDSEQIYKTIASNIPGSLILLFDTDYRCILVEGDLSRHMGLQRNVLLGKKAADVLADEQLTELTDSLSLVFKGKTHSLNVTRFGLDLITRFVPIKDKEGGVSTALAVSIDVSELKETQRQVTELNARLEQKVIERTEELSLVNRELEAFTYSVSHDLRAPLRIIDGFSDLLITEYAHKLDGEGNRALGIVISNARRMGQLIDALLNLSRTGRQELLTGPADMNRLLEPILEEQTRLFPSKGLCLTTDPLLPSLCDERLVRQVWSNLISNALKYTSKREDPRVHIGSGREDGMIVYSVTDNGVGFDMAYAHKLFGIFQRLHKPTEFEGTGVGLALVQRIIARHHGQIWAESEVGKGATFFFSLPEIPVN